MVAFNEVLSRVLDGQTITVSFETPGAAVNARQQYHKWRRKFLRLSLSPEIRAKVELVICSKRGDALVWHQGSAPEIEDVLAKLPPLPREKLIGVGKETLAGERPSVRRESPIGSTGKLSLEEKSALQKALAQTGYGAPSQEKVG